MQKRTKNLLKNTGVYFIGNFSSKLLVFFLLPLYTYYLGPADYGTVDVYINILGIIYSIVSLQSIESVFRFIQDAKDNKERGIVISNSLIIAGLGISAYSIIMLLIEITTDFQYVLLFFFYVTTNILYQYYLQAIRGLNKSIDYSLSGFLSTLIQVICNILFIVGMGLGEVSLLIAPIIANVFAVLFLIKRDNIFKYFSIKHIDKAVIKEHLRYSLPLMPNALCLWAVASLGRYLLLFYYSATEVGLLAFATKFPLLLGIVNSIFFMAWQQSAISEYNSKDRRIFHSNVFNQFVVLQLSILIVILPAVKIIIFTIMGESYREAWIYIPLFFLPTLFNAYANFYSMGFYSAKKTNTVFFASLGTLIIYFVLGVFLAKNWYITGVAIAYTVSQLIYWLIMKFRVKNYLVVDFKIKKPLFLITFLIITVFIYYLGNIYIQSISIIIGLLVTYIVNRKFTIKLVISLKNRMILKGE